MDENFHIYKDGEYSTYLNLKFKFELKLDDYKKRAAYHLEAIDYYWTHHQKLLR